MSSRKIRNNFLPSEPLFKMSFYGFDSTWCSVRGIEDIESFLELFPNETMVRRAFVSVGITTIELPPTKAWEDLINGATTEEE